MAAAAPSLRLRANFLIFLANAAAVAQSLRSVRHAGLSAPETLRLMSVVHY
jgi:hypothetical protein